jgi:mRNA-degrading endonuclease toxin of MazEF toxin-antitoxin module
VITPGDIAARRDSDHELYVAVLSNAIHLGADTGRVITCPFIPGRLADDAMAMVVAVAQPEGTLLPELVQWLPRAALGEQIGTISATTLRETAAIVTALIS